MNPSELSYCRVYTLKEFKVGSVFHTSDLRCLFHCKLGLESIEEVTSLRKLTLKKNNRRIGKACKGMFWGEWYSDTGGLSQPPPSLLLLQCWKCQQRRQLSESRRRRQKNSGRRHEEERERWWGGRAKNRALEEKEKNARGVRRWEEGEAQREGLTLWTWTVGIWQQKRGRWRQRCET